MEVTARLFACLVLVAAGDAAAQATPPAAAAEPAPVLESDDPITPEGVAADAAAAVDAAPAPSADPDDHVAPSPTTLPPPPSTLRLDPDAEAAYRACTDQLATASVDDLTACYATVVVRFRNTEAALKADVATVVLTTRLTPPAEDGLEIPAGRLGISTTLGLFGVWNAIAGGMLVANNVRDANSTVVVAGTGVTALALGIGGGVGGYLLSDALKLDEGAARLAASGVVWGTVIGTAFAPTFANVGDAGFNLAVGGVVAAGYVGGGAALLLTSIVPFDEGQVGMINSGGLIGSTVGALVLVNMADAGVQETAAYSMVFSGATLLGLGIGGVVGRSVPMTWGEALLCDLGAVLGGVAGGTAAFVIGASGADSALLITAPPAVGVVGGYVVTAFMVNQWRGNRGAPVLREGPTLRPVAMAVPVGKSVVPAMGVMGSF